LRRHAPERQADDVGLFDPECVEEAGKVVGQVLDRDRLLLSRCT
jgi:hypothetical protein